MASSLKYDPQEDTYSAHLVYTVKSKGGKSEQKEEKIAVSKTGSRMLTMRKVSSNM
jgi:hypothetical protein